jgi:membrane protease YdiL (CAAX protease family)
MLLLVSPLGGIVAGFTINGLFGFGEEYGWRGWLMDEFRPLGPVGANLLTGVMWGLWHTPLILMGFNFAPYNLIGPLFMVILCTPFSFLLWRARDFTGSLLAPAIIHGMFNGFAGVFVVLIADRNPLLAVATGVVGAAAVALVAAALWLVSAGRLRPTVGRNALQDASGAPVVAPSTAVGNVDVAGAGVGEEW